MENEECNGSPGDCALDGTVRENRNDVNIVGVDGDDDGGYLASAQAERS